MSQQHIAAVGVSHSRLALMLMQLASQTATTFTSYLSNGGCD